MHCYRIVSLRERVELEPLDKSPVRAELSSVAIVLVEGISVLKKYSISVSLLHGRPLQYIKLYHNHYQYDNYGYDTNNDFYYRNGNRNRNRNIVYFFIVYVTFFSTISRYHM